MKSNIYDYLGKIKDSQRKQGMRYALSENLIMVTMGVICDYTAYRELGSYMKSNEKYFIKTLKLKHGVPSNVSIKGS